MQFGQRLKANLMVSSAELGRSQAMPVNFIAQAVPVHRTDIALYLHQFQYK